MRKIFLTFAIVFVFLCPVLNTLAEGDIHNPGYCSTNVCPEPTPTPCPDGEICPPPAARTSESDNEDDQDEQTLLDDLLRLLGL
ncbi:MAG TPA: hypothetical protein VF692_09655 [Pyrinomonadaceae bacterium]|jgi:hypothetical protein